MKPILLFNCTQKMMVDIDNDVIDEGCREVGCPIAGGQ